MSVERAVLHHAEAIASLESLCMPVPWSTSAVHATLELDTTAAWVLRDGEQVIGYLLTSEVVDTAEVLTVGVHPEHRRRGHARALLLHAMASWQDRAVQEAFLDVRDGNTAAQALYESLGFVVVGRRPQMYADGTDAVLMRWTP